MATSVANLGFVVDTLPVLEASRRLDAMGASAQKSAGYLLQTGNAFRDFADDLNNGKIPAGADGLDRLGKSADATRQQLAAFGDTTLGWAKEVPDSLEAVDHAVEGTFVSFAKGMDLVARGITDVRTIKSVFEREMDDGSRSVGDRLSDMARHTVELRLATGGLSAAGLEGAASVLGVGAAAVTAVGGVAAIGMALHNAAEQSRDFEAQVKSLKHELDLTGYASGVTPQLASRLVDQARAESGIDRDHLFEAVGGLASSRDLGRDDVATIFKSATSYAAASQQDVIPVIHALEAAMKDAGAASGDLANIGINLSASQRKQIDGFTEAKNQAGAFGVVLKEVSARTEEFSADTDDSTRSARRFAAESEEMMRNIGAEWRGLLSVFETDVSKYLVDPVRDAFSEILGMANTAMHPTVANLEHQLAIAKSGLAAAQGIAAGGAVQEGIDSAGDVEQRKREVEGLTQKLEEAHQAEISLKALRGHQREKDLGAYNAAKKSDDDANSGGSSEQISELDRAMAAVLKRKDQLTGMVSDLSSVSAAAREGAADEAKAKADGEARAATWEAVTLARKKYDDAVKAGDADAIKSSRDVLTSLFEMDKQFRSLYQQKEDFLRDASVSRQVRADQDALELARAEVQALGSSRAEREKILALTRMEQDARSHGGSPQEVSDEIDRRRPILDQTLDLQAQTKAYDDFQKHRVEEAKQCADEFDDNHADEFLSEIREIVK